MLWAAFDFPRHPLAREDGERVRGAFYAPPSRWLRAMSDADVAAVIDAAHDAALAGAWVLGGLRYEAAAAFDAALTAHRTDQPLAEFAVYDCAPEPWPTELPAARLTGDWQDAQTSADSACKIERIRDWIRAGDCYQVNLTTRLHAVPKEDIADLFVALHASQPGGFSLFLREAGVASVSPELFFDWRPVPLPDRTAQTSWLLAAQPMKGTAARGADKVADDAAQGHLRTSEKERAENLMIVDLLRNDISRVAQLGSLRVPRLFELHALPTVWQMTSTITAVSRARLRLSEVFAALFPCGSVTGTPKVCAMQIIRDLEPTPRGFYCGALGLIQPGGVVTFNVPIRTVEQGDGALTCGIGSAITLDAEAPAELAEWRAKARFLARAQAPIAALETLRLEEGAYVLLDAHLARLQRTAQHFGLRLSMGKVRAALAAMAEGSHAGVWRVRLTVSAQADVDVQRHALAATPSPVVLALAATPIASDNEFLRHKTTRRELYQPFVDAKPPVAFDALMWNEAGELTECTFGNIALCIDGRWLTPRREAGLLPGVLREAMLASGQLHEARLMVSDLQRAESLAFLNSMRGFIPAVMHCTK